MSSARIDKWLWAVRIFKTRTIASEACKKGRISINGRQAKPSHDVKEGDTVCVRKPPVTYSFRVIQPIEKRIGAKGVADVMENITPVQEMELLEMSRISGFIDRQKGTGRPTKKDRRELDSFSVPTFSSEWEEDMFDFDDLGEEEETKE